MSEMPAISSNETWRGPAGAEAEHRGGLLPGGLTGWEVDTLYPIDYTHLISPYRPISRFMSACQQCQPYQ
jgi:hypothetical protein